MVDDLKIPLITKNGHEIMISWACFPVNDKEKNSYNINLVGNIVTDWNDLIEKNVYDYNKNTLGQHSNSLKLINEVKQTNLDLVKRNEVLEKDLKKLDAKLKKKPGEMVGEPSKIVNKGLYSVSELFGGKKKRQEFENMMRELDEREKILNKIENKLFTEKNKITEQIIEFKKWRIRLEQLEQEIENRHKIIERQEKLIMGDVSGSEVTSQVTVKDDLPLNQHIFNKIPDSAAIIQRGIFKKVNESFAGLIGYTPKELVEKSLFEFIDSEAFSDIERFYFNRLKGEDTSFYKTVLITKGNSRINVEVITKPTLFNGEKADIAVVKKLDITDENKN